MRKLLCTAALAGLIGAPAAAGHLDHFLDGKTFKNRGQCQSALMAERNDRRNNDGNTGSYSDPEYNKIVHDKYTCEEVAPGVWIVTIRDSWG